MQDSQKVWTSPRYPHCDRCGLIWYSTILDPQLKMILLAINERCGSNGHFSIFDFAESLDLCGLADNRHDLHCLVDKKVFVELEDGCYFIDWDLLLVTSENPDAAAKPADVSVKPTEDPIDRLTFAAIEQIFAAHRSHRAARKNLNRSLRSEILFLLDGKFFVSPRQSIPCTAIVNHHHRSCFREIPILADRSWGDEAWLDVATSGQLLDSFPHLVEKTKGRLINTKIRITVEDYMELLRQQRCMEHVGLECESLPLSYRFIGMQPEA